LSQDKNYFKGYRNIIRQLEEIQFPEAHNIAMYIMERDNNKTELSPEEIDTAKYIKKIAGYKGDEETLSDGAVSHAIRKNKKRIEDMYMFLVEKGYTPEDIEKFYKKNSIAFYFDASEMNDCFDYLLKLNLLPEQVKNIFMHAVCLGFEALKNRCECVMRYFNLDTLYLLAQGYLFYLYYTDPVDGIEYIVNELGVNKAQELLINEEMFLYLWKEKWQRSDWVHGKQHREALEIIEKYRVG